MGNQQRIVVSVSNDLSTDQRVRKMCASLQERGYDITLLGRLKRDSLPIDRPYKVKRFPLAFEKGALFYASLNMRLFFYLLFADYDRIHANDLDTLLPAYLVALIRKKELVYDSHEIFTEVPEIQGRWVKKVWESIESGIFPKLKKVITVNASIANYFEIKYGNKVEVIRNIPEARKIPMLKSRKDLGLPEDKFIIIIQGSGINVDRGNEEMLEAMRGLSDCRLIFVGSGDAIPLLKQRTEEWGLQDRVQFFDRMPYEDMMQYTLNADLGVSLDKATNLNYKFSLPNKIFDFIHAEIPILCSDLPEVAAIVNDYLIGKVLENVDPEEIISKVRRIKEGGSDSYKSGLKKAAEELSWEKESEVLDRFYSQ